MKDFNDMGGYTYEPNNEENTLLKGDWICYHCREHNFARRKTCYGCNTHRYGFAPSYAPTTGFIHPGDWKCDKCNEVNFARRVLCHKCHASKETSQSTNLTEMSQKPTSRYPGDWVCGKCNENNFARRIICFNCKTQKPGVEIATPVPASQPDGSHPTTPETPEITPQNNSESNLQTPVESTNQENEPENQQNASKTTFQLLEGDWICPKCTEHNFARRVICFRCYQPKNQLLQTSVATGRGGLGMAGRGRGVGVHVGKAPTEDWVCFSCQGHNFAWRTHCFFCEAPKSSRGTGIGVGGTAEMKIGDWICQHCKTHNFARRQDCFGCHLAKQ